MVVAVFGGVTAPGPLLALPDTTETRSHSATENSDCRLIPRFGFSPRDLHAPPRNYLTSNPLVLRLYRTEGLPLQFSLGSASQRNEGTLFESSLGSTDSKYRERTFQCSEGRRNGNTEIILGIRNGSTTLGGKPVEYAYGIESVPQQIELEYYHVSSASV